LYLWLLMERRMGAYSRYAGLAAFVWRIVLTTGTGMIFAFLVARQAYGTALLPPLFIAMSFAWGLAIFLVVQAALYAWTAQTLPADIERRMRRLLGLFVAGVLYFTLVYHLTNAYFAKQVAFERFILLDGGVYPALFWWGYVVAGSLVPLVLVYHPRFTSTRSLSVASLLVIAGAFALLFVFIVGGQAWPLEIFPGHEVHSSFGDGQIAAYAPRLPEWLLGMGGVAIAFVITSVGVRVFPFMPEDDPVAMPAAEAADR
jgi:molybdopterin-containing oxidoreductase family membrane subunit